MEIKILGTGCAKCKSLEKLVREVIAHNDIDASVSKVEDIREIMQFNIMITPALVVDDQVVLKGRIPSANELKDILTNKVFRI